MKRPGAPGTAMPRDARRAITAAMYRSDRLRRGISTTGYRVLEAAPVRTWGSSTHGTARLEHRPERLFLAWRGGRLVGTTVRWLCGSTSSTFELHAERRRPECWRCRSAWEHLQG